MIMKNLSVLIARPLLVKTRHNHPNLNAVSKSILPLWCLILSLLTQNTGAQTAQYWDNNTTGAPTSGTWDTVTANWDPSTTLTASTVVWTNGDSATFAAGSALGMLDHYRQQRHHLRWNDQPHGI